MPISDETYDALPHIFIFLVGLFGIFFLIHSSSTSFSNTCTSYSGTYLSEISGCFLKDKILYTEKSIVETYYLESN